MRRVSVVGNSGSGKSTLARALSPLLGVPHIEIDAINHRAGWRELDRRALCDRLGEAARGDGWIIDGNYRECVMDGAVWARADTVVWLDLPRRAVLRQLVARSLRRVLGRQVLWNGNSEGLRNLVAWDPHRSIIRWAWTQHDEYVARYSAATTDPAFAHLRFVRLRSRTEIDRFLEEVRRTMGAA